MLLRGDTFPARPPPGVEVAWDDSQANGLESLWNMGEGAGGRLTDNTGRGRHGTLTNSPAWTTGPGPHAALTFVGASSQGVGCGPIPSLQGREKATLCGWASRASTNAIVSFGLFVSSFNYFALTLYSDGQVYADASSVTGGYGAFALATAGWHHLAMVFDGSQSGNGGRLKVYLDGVSQTLTYNGTVPAATTSSPGVFEIGRDTSQTRFSSGSLADVRVYTRPLTAGDIADIIRRPYGYARSPSSCAIFAFATPPPVVARARRTLPDPRIGSRSPMWG